MATQATLQIVGMDCSHCAQRLGQALERVEGVIKAQVDPAGTATVRYDENRVRPEELGERVRMAGFDVAG
jgi:copper chaperone CopZ